MPKQITGGPGHSASTTIAFVVYYIYGIIGLLTADRRQLLRADDLPASAMRTDV